MSIGEKLTTIAENEQKVFDAGKQAEYDAFWNTVQLNGNRTSYLYGFAGSTWKEANFKPKYDMYVTNANYMFAYSAIKGDLVEYLEELGIVLDFSKNGGYNNTFQQTDFTRIGVVEFAINPTSPLTGTFMNSELLETIELLKIADSGQQTFGSTFNGCTALKHIKVTGKIGTAFDIHYSPLDKESILSIANAVLDKAFTIKFNLDAVNKAFETSEGANDGSTSTEWTNLWIDKPKVSISLQNV